MKKKIKIIFVVGPTASGKTGLGVKIAKAVGGEVISADSMQIYKDMHIASAAADSSEQDGIPHHLLEFLDYGESFSVYEYVSLARKKAEEISKRGKTPVIVGGTGLYINALADNIVFEDDSQDLKLRAELEAEFDRLGGEEMLKKLKETDCAEAARLHPNDRKRIIRAFEIYKLTGKTKTEQDALSKRNESPFEPLIIGLTYKDRDKLYERINRRVDIMLENGLLDEAKQAYDRRNGLSSGAVQAIGHKEFFPYFEGEISLEEAAERLKRKTRNYAKRQLTWFNARKDIIWLYPDQDGFTEKLKKTLESGGYREGQ